MPKRINYTFIPLIDVIRNQSVVYFIEELRDFYVRYFFSSVAMVLMFMSHKRRNKTMNTGKILISAAVGAVVGMAVGMLYAPAKGSATRKKIVKSGIGYAENVKDTVDEYFDTLTEEFDVVRNEAKKWVDKEKKKVASLVGK